MQYRISYRRGGSFWLGPIGLLLITNVVLYIATFIQRDILYFLALKPLFFANEPWTLFTCMFVHGSLWHILFNMFALYFFGSFCINLIGRVPFLIVYFIGGIASSLAVLFLSSPLTIGYGASGAIFALAGVCVAIRPKTTVFIFPFPVPIPLWIAILIFVAFSFLPGISWQGHLGGLLLGIIVGLIYRVRRQRVTFDL